MENYFPYFTEIEEHFFRRRGHGLVISTLDWALIETWKDAGIPLEAVLRGIDTTFDHWEQRPSKTKKVNGLAFCSQEVLAAAEDMKEAAVGAVQQEKRTTPGPEVDEIAVFLERNAAKLLLVQSPLQAKAVAGEGAETLTRLADEIKQKLTSVRLEDLERHLTILEEKLLAALTMSAPDQVLLTMRTQADREMAPYRGKMPVAQVEQVRKHYIHRSLFEKFDVPRLSLFYM